MLGKEKRVIKGLGSFWVIIYNIENVILFFFINIFVCMFVKS